MVDGPSSLRFVQVLCCRSSRRPVAKRRSKSAAAVILHDRNLSNDQENESFSGGKWLFSIRDSSASRYRGPPLAPRYHITVIYEGFQGIPSIAPHQAVRCEPLIQGSSLGLQSAYTQINLFKILLNQTEIRLYLTFSDWFGTKRTSVWFQINRNMVNSI